MGAFEYTALDTTGKEKKGVLQGDTARQIRQSLREQGLSPLSVEEVRQKEARNRQQFFFRHRISTTDLALITRQLATLAKSGLPVDESLNAVAKQTEKSRLKSMLLAVRSRVMEGHSLAAALGDFPYIFPELYRATVAAGEQSGYLNVVLDKLADYSEDRQQLNQKMSVALIYPIALTLVAIAVVMGLLAYVVPKVVQVFESTGQELPLLTRALIALSDLVSAYGLVLFVVAIMLVVAFRYFLQYEAFRFKYHQVLLRLPLVAKLVRGINTASFARTLSILSASGVPVLDGLRIASQVMVNLPMRNAVKQATRRVREGGNLHTALEASGYFPPMTIHLIASGEASGKLEEMLGRAAGSQEREMETLRAQLLGWFEPLIIVVMGIVVGTIVLAILLPIFEMNQLVR